MQTKTVQSKEKHHNDFQKHRELCMLVGKWLYCLGRIDPPSCSYVALEMVTANCEVPDIIGFCFWTSLIVEAKVSRSDFLADAN